MTKRLTDQEKKQFNEKIDNVLSKRIQIAEFPMDENGLYTFWRSIMPYDVIMALDTVNGDSLGASLMNERTRVEFNTGPFHNSIRADSRVWSTGRGGITVNDNHPMYEVLHDFAAIRYRVDNETEATGNFARNLIFHASAAGQIKRVWPELASFLSKQANDSLREVQRASRIPPSVNMEEFHKNSEMFNRVLAEGHILPDLEHNSMTFAVRILSP